jgi:hypothetical protein
MRTVRLTAVDWSAENTVFFPEVPLHDIGVGVWCAISAARIVEPINIPETMNSYTII